MKHQSAPPPPPPLPASGFFNSTNAPPAPPPPPIMTQPSMSMNVANSSINNSQNGQVTTNGNSYLNEIGKFQANKLKKVSFIRSSNNLVCIN